MKEVEGLRQMVEDMREAVARLRVEETRSRVTATGVNQDIEEQAGEEAAGNSKTVRQRR